MQLVRWAALTGVGLGVACQAHGPEPAVPVPATRILTESLPPSRSLPPVAPVRGPLQLTVRYPAPDAVLQIRDSSFLFGTAGTGDARVSVNGQPARVWPNGAWLAYVALRSTVQLTGQVFSSDLLAGTAQASIQTRR